MDKNNSSPSSSSVCRKIRQALASNPAVRAVQRISSFNQQEPKPVTKNPNSPSSSITNISIQSKPPPHHNKAHTEGSAANAIPIKFDQSVAKGPTSERETKVAAKGEREPRPQHVSMQVKQQQQQHHAEAQGKKAVDINEHFKEFILSTREKMMRSVTNIGWAQSNHHPAAAPDDQIEAHGSNKNESQFSEFIQRARKKLRTTTTVRKSGSLRKE